MLHDNKTKTDLLAYEPIANSIAGLLTEPRYAPITIGVHEIGALASRASSRWLNMRWSGTRTRHFDGVWIISI